MPKKRKYQTAKDVVRCLEGYIEEYGDLPIRIRLAGLLQRPIISGIRYNGHVSDNLHVSESIEIVPHYDIKGDLNKFSGVNSVIKELANVQTLFVQYAQGMMSMRTLLEEIAKRGGKVSSVKAGFNRLYDIAKNIRDGVFSLKRFDKHMLAVINESIKDDDYAATFEHHIDGEMTDAGFAALVSDGAGKTTDIQRLETYVEISKKINAEIDNRKRRIVALKKRIKADKNTQESINARTLIGKLESIVATLIKRRSYIRDRYKALKNMLTKKMKEMSATIENANHD